MYIGTDSFFPRAKDELPPYSPLPLQVGPMNTASASGTALKAPPVGSGAKPQSTNDLVHIGIKKCSSGGSIFLLIFLRSNVVFCTKNKLDIVQRVQFLTGRAL